MALPPRPGFGALLREARRRTGTTQLALALDAGVSARHLSWLETGRAQPSRAMLLRLAERLALPLRERNAWLAAAGFAALYAERPLADPALAPAREALAALLAAHEPWPALAVDRHWNLVAANRACAPFVALADPALHGPPLNVMRLSLHPRGLAPFIENLAAWRAHALARLARQAATTRDPALAALLAELRALPGPVEDDPSAGDPDALALPMRLLLDGRRLCFLSTITVFGAPHDLTLADIAVETLLPADAATAAALRAMQPAEAGATA